VNPNLCATPISCRDGWCWENPLPQGNTLNAVWATGSERWAVGAVGTVLHYNGSFWKLAPSPTRSALRAVVGRSASDIWAAGDDGVILHYDGGTWGVAHVDPNQSFRAVAIAPTGEVFVGGEQGRMLENVNGGWQLLPPPLDTINALWAFSATNVFAGGSSAATQSLAQWNGSWSPISIGSIQEVDALLGTRDGGLLAGASDCSISLLNGLNFMQIAAISPCDGGVRALAGTAVDDFFAVGPGFINQYSPIFSTSLTNAGNWFGASASGVATATFVGQIGLLASNNPSGFQIATTGSRLDVTSVFAADSGEVFAGSDRGQLLERTVANGAGRWNVLTGNIAGERVLSVWGTSSDDVWAVTDQGTIAHDVSGLVVVAPAPVQPLYGVTHHRGEVQIVGADAGALRIPDGLQPGDAIAETLPAQVMNNHQTLRGTFSDGTQLFAVTNQGDLIESDNGHTWMKDQFIGTDLRAVHGAPGFVLIAGGDGGVFTGDGGQMSLAFTGSHADFNGAFAFSSTSAWVVGDLGAALPLSGSTWSNQPAPTREDLLGVYGGLDGGLFAVGRNGTVLFRP
jgi:hypothetical protein